MSDTPNTEAVWFIGPWRQPGYYLKVSVAPGYVDDATCAPSSHSAPPGFPWTTRSGVPTMDRNEWGACYKPQGTTAMDYKDGWSVLSVADYTVDSRPNVMAIFAVHRAEVPEADMCALAAERFPTVWHRLGAPRDAGASSE